MLFTPNSDPKECCSHKLRFIRPCNLFPLFFCPVLFFLCSVSLLLLAVRGVFSDTVTHLVQGLTCCVFKNALLQTSIILLSFCQHEPFTFSPPHQPLTGYFLLFHSTKALCKPQRQLSHNNESRYWSSDNFPSFIYQTILSKATWFILEAVQILMVGIKIKQSKMQSKINFLHTNWLF